MIWCLITVTQNPLSSLLRDPLYLVQEICRITTEIGALENTEIHFLQSIPPSTKLLLPRPGSDTTGMGIIGNLRCSNQAIVANKYNTITIKESKMKPTSPMPYFAAVLMSALLFNQSAMAADVKITPLGSQ